MRATEKLHDLGQSLWLDNITRDLLTTRTLEHYINELSVTGLTSNPTIFDHAIKNSAAYDAAIRKKLHFLESGEPIFFELALGVPPKTGAAAGAVLGQFGGAVAAGLSDDFVRGGAGLIKPGTSALFVQDDGGDIDAILPAIRGMGGTLVKTNVDQERAKRVQASLTDSSDTTQPIGHLVPSGRGES